MARLAVVAVAGDDRGRASPIVSGWVPGRPPQVLFLILGGIVIEALGAGPGRTPSTSNCSPGWGWAVPAGRPRAGPTDAAPEHPDALAWGVSAALAVLVVGGLEYLGYVKAFVPVAIALTTTALGTLLPILREQQMLAGPFGRYIFAAGAVGELLPILAISLFPRRLRLLVGGVDHRLDRRPGPAPGLADPPAVRDPVAAIIGEHKHATLAVDTADHRGPAAGPVDHRELRHRALRHSSTPMAGEDLVRRGQSGWKTSSMPSSYLLHSVFFVRSKLTQPYQ